MMTAETTAQSEGITLRSWGWSGEKDLGPASLHGGIPGFQALSHAKGASGIHGRQPPGEEPNQGWAQSKHQVSLWVREGTKGQWRSTQTKEWNPGLEKGPCHIIQ